MASGSVGISGTRMQQDVRRQVGGDHRVDQAESRRRARGASSAEQPASRLAAEEDGAERGGVDPEPQVEPVGREALHDEAAAERVQARRAPTASHTTARERWSPRRCHRPAGERTRSAGASSAAATGGEERARGRRRPPRRAGPPADTHPVDASAGADDLGHEAAGEGAERGRQRARPAQYQANTARPPAIGATTCASAACSIDRNGPTSLPLGLIDADGRRRAGAASQLAVEAKTSAAIAISAAPTISSAPPAEAVGAGSGEGDRSCRRPAWTSGGGRTAAR